MTSQIVLRLNRLARVEFLANPGELRFCKSTMPFILGPNSLRNADLGLASSLMYRVATRESFNDDDENVACI